MKKIKLFLYKYRKLYIVLLIIFMFLLTVYSKEKQIFNLVKGSIIDIQSFITPKINVSYLDMNKGINKDILNELNELKSILDLNNSSNYKYINSSVLSRNVNTYFSTITIDKGKKDGITNDLACVNQEGLIGYVSKVFNNHSTVTLLNSSSLKNISVSVSLNGNIYNGNISGYDLIKNELIITSIRTNSKIDKGAVVETNGYGNIIPAGINIGKVTNVKVEDNTASKILKVKIDSNLDDIKYVSVIRNEK